jgi:hypothetical protein
MTSGLNRRTRRWLAAATGSVGTLPDPQKDNPGAQIRWRELGAKP